MRLTLAALLVCAGCTGAAAQATGDFDCLATLAGVETPAGLLRIDEPTRFAFLDPATATPGPSHPMDASRPDEINFDDAFAAHISPGAIVSRAAFSEERYAYEAWLLAADGREIFVSCPYIP